MPFYRFLPIRAKRRRCCIRPIVKLLLHLPMEPLSYPKEKPGTGALFTDMNDEEIVFQLEKNLASVPYVSGVNNHMGSKFMADEEKLMPVFKQLKKEGFVFYRFADDQSFKNHCSCTRKFI